MRPAGRTGILKGLLQCGIKKPHYACFVNEFSVGYINIDDFEKVEFLTAF
jgi:hypothetical protein